MSKADSSKAGQEGAAGTDRGFTPASDFDCRRVWTASRTRHVVILSSVISMTCFGVEAQCAAQTELAAAPAQGLSFQPRMTPHQCMATASEK